ncbi:MAG: hypothetical protein ABSG87_03180 [Verrucomicrobiota bacterium]
MTQRKLLVPPAFVLAVWMAVAFSTVAQSTNTMDYSSFQIVGQRNIFDPNRTPHSRFSSTRSTRVADSFSFVGSMSYAKGNFAFFDGTSSDFRKVAKVDDTIADFKVVAIGLSSVTLSFGTNEMVLFIGTQMRRDDDGQWMVSTETASYSGVGNSPVSESRGRFSNRRHGGSSQKNSSMTSAADDSQMDDANASVPGDVSSSDEETNSPEISTSPPTGGANDALTRLMQIRAQEEQQLGQGQ